MQGAFPNLAWLRGRAGVDSVVTDASTGGRAGDLGGKPAESRDWIDFAKGIAIILVVLYHSSLFLAEFDLAGSTGRLRSVLSFLPMPIFFFIAGLTMRRMLTWSFADLWRRRLQALVYLYVLWSVIRVVFYVVVPHLRGAESSPTDLRNVALLPVWPTSSYWFIWAMVLFTLGAWLLRKVPPSITIPAAALVALASTTTGGLDLNNVGWDRIMQNFVFFLAAIFIPHATYRFAARIRPWHAVAFMVVYAGLAIATALLHLSRVPGVVLIVSVIGVAMTIALSEKLAKMRGLGFVNTLGAHSFQIYLLHLFVVAIVLAVVAPLADLPALQQIANLLPWALAAFALYVSLLLFKMLRRFSWLWVSPFKRRTTKKPRPSAVSPTE
ncbi:acyltransferase family protein [Cryobacterium sp.]|jgi:uncharacterized membrane protein YcfT|uniref:acyltransferase family protein n=1 Tax=Cryobacterium sp. TaxID=1926290 RepID=UPI002634B86A|nr:acyltransferase family protein [Cryobacterium sp.]MCU1447407.1 Acyltransferase family protein [Cryobacterium sp.]